MDNNENEYIILILKLNKAINKRNNLSELISILIGILSAILGLTLMFNFIESNPKPNNNNIFPILGMCFFYGLTFWQFWNAIFIGDIQFPPNELINQRQNYINKVISIKRNRFKRALNGKNKKIALTYGRDYYQYLRGGELSIYDEAALSNDISSMK